MPDSKKRIRTGLFSRSLSLAKMAVSTGTKIAVHNITTVLDELETKDIKWAVLLKERTESIANELGLLKGSLLKAGQMLSMYGEHFLPPEANQFLRKLQSDVPPLDWSIIENILLEQFGTDVLSQLEIEKTPLGSASLGQAHKAVIKKTGQVLVLKIQYPGVAEAIDSDLKSLKSALSLLKLLPKNFNSNAIFDEVKNMLQQELDYEQEATETELYREKLLGDSRFRVPLVYREFCRTKVIATSFESGISPGDTRIESRNQEQRNLLAENFLYLYFMELFEWGTVQTDPHLGNYKIDGDQLVLLDFGAIRRYDLEFLKSYRKMIRSAILQDRRSLRAVAEKMKFISEEDDPVIQQLFEEFCLMIVEPFLSSKDYDWGNTDLPERATAILMRIFKRFHLRSPPSEILFLDRKMGGVFIFLKVLRAKINGRKIIDPFLQKLEAE